MALWRAKKTAKDEAYWSTRAIMGFAREKHDGARVPVKLTLHPVKGKAAPDADNAIASCKAAIDGFSAAIGIDDKLFDIAFAFGEPVERGALVIEVGP